MPDSSEEPWTNNPNAPRLTNFDYVAEKSNFAGILTGAILYGIDTVLFFQCMSALLGPTDHRPTGSIKWGLVTHTVVMFLSVTVYAATTLDTQSISYVDNREFPGTDRWSPGSLGYQFFIYSDAITVIPSAMFTLNQWLTDGLLLYRCYLICSRNIWTVAFPGLMYFTSVAMGITAAYYQVSQQYTKSISFGIPYFTISLSLNILLTIMIVVRLVLRDRRIRDAMGSLVRLNNFYKAVVTILIESCALYSISSILNIGPWCTNNPVQFAFFPILVQTQVIAPFLIILRVANQRALTKDAIDSGGVGSIHFRSRGESLSGDSTLADGNPTSPTGTCGGPHAELSAGTGTTINLPH